MSNPETNKPFFSVVIPTLNEEKCLPNLLKDLTKQTFTDFEVIIVDGNSEDKTIKKAAEFKNKFKNLEIITTDKRNVCTQRNLGGWSSKSDWIVFMDADNRIPHYFLQGIKFQLEFHDCEILSVWIEPDSNDPKDKAVARLINIFIDIQKARKNPFLLEAMICISKESFKKLKGFDERLPFNEGSSLLRTAVKKRMKFSLVKNPRYKYSFRRLRKQGTLKTMRNVAEIEWSKLLNKQIPKEKAKHLYPMEGGKYFEIEKFNSSNIEKFFLRIFYNYGRPIYKNGKNIFSWLFGKN